MIYPALGRHPKKGIIDFRWNVFGQNGFVFAVGPVSWRAFVSFLKYPLGLD